MEQPYCEEVTCDYKRTSGLVVRREEKQIPRSSAARDALVMTSKGTRTLS
jgi:hypothetical protein